MKTALLLALAAAVVADARDTVGLFRRAQGVTSNAGELCADDSRTKCSEVGEPLIVTDLLRKGESPSSIKNKTRVDPQIGKYPSYAGYATTDIAKKNNMFWWYFPSQDGNASAPLLIWLQGGPGGSSLFGLLSEMGPLMCTSPTEVAERPVTWNDKYAMLFIDNPVGAGFSYTEADGYCENEDQVAENLYALLEQFYSIFTELQHVPLYITGESYGGHYVPAISYKIHMANNAPNPPSIRIPLKGLAIGDGWIDPVNMIPGYPDMFFNFGLADMNQKAKFQDYCDRTVALIHQGKMKEAFDVWDEMLNGDIFPYGNYFHNITGSNDYDNFLRTDAPASFGYFSTYVSQASVRQAIHAGSQPFGMHSRDCEMHLLADFHATMRPRLEALLDAKEQYKVLIYSGQLDVIIAARLRSASSPECSGTDRRTTRRLSGRSGVSPPRPTLWRDLFVRFRR
eukprot:Sspe_Gene.35172::Locus_17055_Transcript_1_1_Confidence_1.000_Length_1640::g.35172::m.35172/K09645/CPVL; vitellogenic carboxypeptidase-like protein